MYVTERRASVCLSSHRLTRGKLELLCDAGCVLRLALDVGFVLRVALTMRQSYAR